MPGDRPALVALALALLGGAVASRRAPRGAAAAALAVAAALAIMLARRWIASGHPPVFGTFEMDLAEALALLVSAFLLDRRIGPGSLRAPLLVSALTLVHAAILRTAPTPLTISEQSLWIDLHAPLAWAAWCLYLHAAFLAFRSEESLALRALGYGFIAQSAMAFVGIYYATLLFASPWSWDPVQTLGLASWLLAALAMHFRLFHAVSMHRQRYFLAFVAVTYVVSGKAIMYMRPGQSFHVFELGALAGEGSR